MKSTLTLMLCFALALCAGACSDGHDHDHPHPHDKDGGSGKALQDAKTATPPAGYVNANCPIMGKPVDVEKGGSVAWGDSKVGFCCPGCETAWNKLSDDEKKAKLAQ